MPPSIRISPGSGVFSACSLLYRRVTTSRILAKSSLPITVMMMYLR